MANGAIAGDDPPPPGFVDATAEFGLNPDLITGTARLCTADLNNDGWPDAIIDRHLVFLNVANADAPSERQFERIDPDTTGLLAPVTGTVVVFADLDNDGTLDAITTEFVDLLNENWTDHGRRTRWQRGNGDGTFGEAMRMRVRDIAFRPLGELEPDDGVEVDLPPATSCALAVSDVTRNGWLDVLIGNWYTHYGQSLAAFPNQHLLNLGPRDNGTLQMVMNTSPSYKGGRPIADWGRAIRAPDETYVGGGDPTYGMMVATIQGTSNHQHLLELNYGRRANRIWALPLVSGTLNGKDASDLADYRGGIVETTDDSGLDGDPIRHGEYPEWAVQRMAQRDPPIELKPEPSFRVHGITFDCAVGDVDNDGFVDVVLAEVTHGWAGESSDRTRVLRNFEFDQQQQGLYTYQTIPEWNVDRVPEGENNWNQGDLFCELADLNHDTRLDLVLSSGDYPDNQRLRMYLQQEDGTFNDCTEALGIDHDGSQQISLADVDHDGDLDLFAGQTFFRYSAKQKAGRTPQVRLWRNECTQGRKSLVLKLRGDGTLVNCDAIGAQVFVTLADGTRMRRQLIGIGGHAGKQHEFIVHFGLGEHDVAEMVMVRWRSESIPRDAHVQPVMFRNVAAGRYEIDSTGRMQPIGMESAP